MPHDEEHRQARIREILGLDPAPVGGLPQRIQEIVTSPAVTPPPGAPPAQAPQRRFLGAGLLERGLERAGIPSGGVDRAASVLNEISTIGGLVPPNQQGPDAPFLEKTGLRGMGQFLAAPFQFGGGMIADIVEEARQGPGQFFFPEPGSVPSVNPREVIERQQQRSFPAQLASESVFGGPALVKGLARRAGPGASRVAQIFRGPYRTPRGRPGVVSQPPPPPQTGVRGIQDTFTPSGPQRVQPQGDSLGQIADNVLADFRARGVSPVTGRPLPSAARRGGAATGGRPLPRRRRSRFLPLPPAIRRLFGL